MSNINRYFKLGLSGTTALLSSACTFGVVSDAEKVIQADRNDATDLVASSRIPLPKADSGPVTIRNDIWLGNSAKSLPHGDPLPRSVERGGVVLIGSDPLGLMDIANLISETTNIPTIIDSDVWVSSDSNSSASADPVQLDSSSNADDSTTTELFTQDDVFGNTGELGMDNPFVNSGGEVASTVITEDTGMTSLSPNASAESIYMLVDHEGRLSDFLNKVSMRYRINWEYKDSKIRFFRNETRTYLLKVMPSTSSASMDVSSSGSEEGAFGSANQSSSNAYEVDIWTDITDNLSDIVSNMGGTISVARSTGTVTVTGTSEVLRKVERHISAQNERFSKQITVNVQVFNVGIEDSDEYGTDISTLLDTNTLLSAGFTNTGVSGDMGGGSLAFNILKPTGIFTGTSGLVRALSKKGDVSVVTTANATTLNNVPTPLQVGNSRNYVAAVTSETDSETGAQTFSIETDSVTTGFNMQLLPRVLSNGVVALQYSINTSELIGANDGFDLFTAGDNQVQLPNMNTRAFNQQVMIPNGNSLILSGFEQTKSSVQKQGVGNANNWFTGGSNAASMRRDVMVIMITPVIVDAGKVIERVN